MSIKKILVTLLVIGILGVAGFWFKNNIVAFYHSATTKIQDFQKTDFGDIVNEVARDVLSPDPLNIGGKSNAVVLTSKKVITETNLQRQQNGNLPALKENEKLNAAAKAKADDMFKNQYFEHISPSGIGPGDLATTYGYEYITEGENLILGNFTSEKEVVQDWMNSPGHRANILNNRFTEIGVAMVKGTYKGQTAWIGVQEFGLPLSSCSPPSVTLKNQINSNKAVLDQLSVAIQTKRNEINTTDQYSPKYNQLVDEYNQMVDQYNKLNDQTKKFINNYNSQVTTFNQCVKG